MFAADYYKERALKAPTSFELEAGSQSKYDQLKDPNSTVLNPRQPIGNFNSL